MSEYDVASAARRRFKTAWHLYVLCGSCHLTENSHRSILFNNGRRIPVYPLSVKRHAEKYARNCWAVSRISLDGRGLQGSPPAATPYFRLLPPAGAAQKCMCRDHMRARETLSPPLEMCYAEAGAGATLKPVPVLR
jgi:hypothetical protein